MSKVRNLKELADHLEIQVPSLKGINISRSLYREFAEIFGLKTNLLDSIKGIFYLEDLLNSGSNGRVIESTQTYSEEGIIERLKEYGLKSRASKKVFEFINSLEYQSLAPQVILKIESSKKNGILYYRFIKSTSGSPGSLAS